MKQKDITIGQTYRCKVSGSLVEVRITAENPHGGWDAVNILTKRKVRIKSAQRLRGKTPPRPTSRKKIVSLAQYEAEAAAEKAAAGKKGVVVPTGKPNEFAKHLDRAVAAAKQAPRAKKGKKATTKAKTPKPRATGKRGAATGKTGGKPMGCLTAAVQVLKDRGRKDGPLSCPEMITRMGAKGYWQSAKGKTPAATLYSGILREIRAKGTDSRFKKAARGKFTLTS